MVCPSADPVAEASFCQHEMSVLRRAKTWEISESEDSEPDLSAASGRDGGRGEREEKHTDPPPPPPPAAASSEASARKRRSKEELEAARLEAKQRREERERRRAARAAEKEERRQEQQRRREAADGLKRLRPENRIKELTVRIQAALLQHDGSDILLDTLASLQWRFTVESQLLAGSISWTRALPQKDSAPQRGEDGRAGVEEEEEEEEEEEQVLLVRSLSEFVDVVVSVKEMVDGGGVEAGTGTGTVLSPLLECLNRKARKVVTMLVTDSESDRWTEASGERFPGRTLRTKLGMRSRDVEEVLVYLQLHRNVSVVFLESWRDVADHVCAVTRALSKRPFRLLTERSELPFCVDGSWAGGARVERDGSGLRAVWSRQVQQLNRVSPAAAAALTRSFPSPQLLLQAYRRLESEAERKGMLADVSVKTEGKERRIGPDISARMFRCLTAQNPQLVLD